MLCILRGLCHGEEEEEEGGGGRRVEERSQGGGSISFAPHVAS